MIHAYHHELQVWRSYLEIAPRLVLQWLCVLCSVVIQFESPNCNHDGAQILWSACGVKQFVEIVRCMSMIQRLVSTPTQPGSALNASTLLRSCGLAGGALKVLGAAAACLRSLESGCVSSLCGLLDRRSYVLAVLAVPRLVGCVFVHCLPQERCGRHGCHTNKDHVVTPD